MHWQNKKMNKRKINRGNVCVLTCYDQSRLTHGATNERTKYSTI